MAGDKSRNRRRVKLKLQAHDEIIAETSFSDSTEKIKKHVKP